MIDMYNKYMGGVDKSDQLLCYHSSSRYATRYWKTMFYYLLEVAVTNVLSSTIESIWSRAKRHAVETHFGMH